MRFKYPSILLEIERAHPRLQALALYVDDYAKRTFGHDLMLTDVERTQEEYDSIYHQTPYLGPRPHLAPQSHAADFRTTGELTDAQAKQLVEHVNSFWPRRDGKPSAIFHDVAGPHVHFQSEV